MNSTSETSSSNCIFHSFISIMVSLFIFFLIFLIVSEALLNLKIHVLSALPLHDIGHHPFICDFFHVTYIWLSIFFLSFSFYFSRISRFSRLSLCIMLGVRYSIPPSSSKRFPSFFNLISLGSKTRFAEWWFFLLLFFSGSLSGLSLVIDVRRTG